MDIELRAEDGHALAAYAAGPPDAARGLVVAQEIFGVNRHMRRVCDDFAAQGYAVVCPALFDRTGERGVELGYAPEDVARGRELRGRIAPALTVLDIRAAAAALPPGAERRRGNDVTVALSGDDAETLRRWWGRLSDGGEVETELERQMWGDEFGACTDRFGVHWLVNIAGGS